MLKKVVPIAIIVIVLIAIFALPVIANSNDNLTMIYEHEDTFWNYDFVDEDYVGDEDYVDQPLTIIFCGQSSVVNCDKTRVKSEFDSDGFTHDGSTMYNELDDSYYWDEDTDDGKKTSSIDWNGYHYRVYAADGADMYNATWYEYVIATTHRDIRLWDVGYSEDCEDYICSLADEKSGWTVYEDLFYVHNRDWPGWDDGWQYWQCDGYASRISLP